MTGSLASLVELLTATVIAVAVSRLCRLPPMLAYLTVGIAVGPFGFGLLAESDEANHLAEFGVVFLMFSIGLEFSLARLKAMRRLVFGFGGAQVGVTLAATTAVTVFYFGQDWRTGFAVGAICAMSSTAIVSKLLSERLELHSTSGRQTMAVLLFQDLAVVPLLIVIPALGDRGTALGSALSLALVQAALVLTVLVVLGQRLMRRWFDAVAHQKSTELFMLNVLWVVIGLSWLTALAGLSLALGAFVAGMLISETVYRHQVEADIRPFRDVLLGFFFVTIGMLLDVGFVARNLPAVLLALLMLIVAKGGIVMLLALVMKHPREVGIRTAIHLAQAGEFGFVLLELSGEQHLLPVDVRQITMAAMLLSMFVAPFLIARAGGIGRRVTRGEFFERAEVIQQVAVHSMDVRDHVILCGFGRTGQSLAGFLDRENIPFIALDIDAGRIRLAQEAGENVVFGNADRREVLMAAGIERARAVVVTYADAPSTEKALEAIHGLRPGIPVIVRAQDESQIARFKHLGASEVVPEVLEASLMLATQMLAQLSVPMERAMERVRSQRSERYASMRAFYRGESDRALQAAQEKTVVFVEANAYAVGRSLGELDLPAHGVMVEVLRRKGQRLRDPGNDTLIEAGDGLILAGDPVSLLAAERYLLDGQ